MITVRGSPPLDPGKYTSAIFFDNDHKKIKNIENICPIITRHLVDEMGPDVFPIRFTDEPINIVIADAGGDTNTYLQYLKRNNVIEDYYDPFSGLDMNEHGPIIEEWLTTVAVPEDAIIIFDWDRTITVFEGFYSPDTLAGIRNPDQFLEDALRYMMGGDERLAAFRDMCSNIIGYSGASVAVLTNNGKCITEFFKALVNQLFPETIEDIFLICSRPPPYSGHKGFKLQSISHFSDVCQDDMSGGGGGRRRSMRRRTRRRSRRNHKRKTNRRRGIFNKNYL